MLEIIRNNDHQSGLRYRGVTIHHPDHPDEEARVHIAGVKAEMSGLLLVFGLGLGYHLEALAERWPQARIMAFDPDPALRKVFSEHVGLVDPNQNRLTVVHDWADLTEFITREIVHGNHPDPAVFIHPGYRILFPQDWRAFEDIIRGARLRRAVADKTRKEKGRLFLTNLAANLPDLLDRPDLTDLSGRLPGLAGFIVGSGPGLEKNGKLLRKVEGRGLILAAGSARRPLAELGVRPDMIIVVEAEDTSDFLKPAALSPDTLLVLASACHPAHFSVPGFTQTVFHATAGAACLLGQETFVPQAGTAGSAAFTLGLLLGLNPLVLVGQDQAFSDGRLHAQGTPGSPPSSSLKGFFQVEGIEGRPVPTHSGFVASLHWFAEAIQYLKEKSPERTVINASENGARIPGWPELRLEEVLRGLKPGPQKAADLPQLIAGLGRPEVGQVRERLEQTWAIIDRVSQLARAAPQGLSAAWNDCRANHPFLAEVLSAPADGYSLDEIKPSLQWAETLIIKMFEALDRYEKR